VCIILGSRTLTVTGWVGEVFGMALAFFWTLEVLRHLLHVAGSGLVAMWWVRPDAHDCTQKAFTRAATSSFGTICFGSALIMIADAVRIAYWSWTVCLFFLFEPMLVILDKFTNMVFTEVGIYAMDFRSAATDSYRLLTRKSRNTGLATNMISSWTVWIGKMFGTAISGLIAVAWTTNRHSDWQLVWLVICLAIGYVTTGFALSVIQAAISTTFVVMLQDWRQMKKVQPDNYKIFYDAAIATGYDLEEGHDPHSKPHKHRHRPHLHHNEVPANRVVSAHGHHVLDIPLDPEDNTTTTAAKQPSDFVASAASTATAPAAVVDNHHNTVTSSSSSSSSSSFTTTTTAATATDSSRNLSVAPSWASSRDTMSITAVNTASFRTAPVVADGGDDAEMSV